MRGEPVWRRYMRLLGADPAADLDDELRHHLERRVEEYVARGMSRDEAESAARDRLGDVARVKRECGAIAEGTRRARARSERLQDLIGETRYAARRLRRRPVFAAAATITLGVGIGATAAVFAVVDGVLLEPLPFPDSDRLVDLTHTAPGWSFDEIRLADGTYFTYRDENRVFEDLGLWNAGEAAVTGIGEPEEIDVMRVTDGLLPVLRVQASRGRRFVAADDLPGAALTTMLSHDYWRTRFGADPGVVGSALRVDGISREIIGVLPPGFRLLDYEPQILLPLRLDRSVARISNFSYRSVARLRADATVGMATAEIDRLIPIAVERTGRGLPQEMIDDARLAGVVRPLKDRAVGGVRRILWTLLGTVGIVLLIAAANVAGLFMVRGEALQQEVAVRAALGASSGRAARGFTVESMILGMAGGALGLLVAALGLATITGGTRTGLPRITEISIDLPVIVLTLVLSLVAALGFGRMMIVRFGRPDLVRSLREGGRGGGDSRVRQRARGGLVVTQIALALVLLVGAGLMVRSLEALRSVRPGFQHPGDVLTFRISIPRAEEPDPALVARMHEEIVRRVSAIPGVASAALVSRLPMEEGLSVEDYVLLEDFPTAEGGTPNLHRFKWVSGDYFETMGNPVLAGRALTWADTHDHGNVVVISEDLALRYWGDVRSPIGRRLRNEPDVEWREIVGVVGAVHDDGPDRDPVGLVFWPQVQDGFWGNSVFTQASMAYVIRSAGTRPSALVDAMRDAVREVNPNLPMANVTTLRDLVRQSTARTEFTVLMLAIAAAVAVLLGVVGLYGVVSYAVATRTREIGVRMALGARGDEVARMVVGQGARLAALGLAVGVVVALMTSRLLSALLYGVEVVDLPTYAVTASLLGAVALLASYLPARRAARVEPTEALRHE